MAPDIIRYAKKTPALDHLHHAVVFSQFFKSCRNFSGFQNKSYYRKYIRIQGPKNCIYLLRNKLHISTTLLAKKAPSVPYFFPPLFLRFPSRVVACSDWVSFVPSPSAPSTLLMPYPTVCRSRNYQLLTFVSSDGSDDYFSYRIIGTICRNTSDNLMVNGVTRGDVVVSC